MKDFDCPVDNCEECEYHASVSWCTQAIPNHEPITEEYKIHMKGFWDGYESARREYDCLVKTQKHGMWVKVTGYVTPGGDPVWECSECGKGRHVYGVEASSYQRDVSDQQWVTCPNCGARMVGDNDER